MSESAAWLGGRGVHTSDVADPAGQPAVMVDPKHAHGVPIVLLGSA